MVIDSLWMGYLAATKYIALAVYSKISILSSFYTFTDIFVIAAIYEVIIYIVICDIQCTIYCIVFYQTKVCRKIYDSTHYVQGTKYILIFSQSVQSVGSKYDDIIASFIHSISQIIFYFIIL